ncbi:hypothetical protein BAUCODRAFT_76882 [Baudoinia panamericana UAMH 10762]|uniref:BTB domain-containing protein n=1 Tax=Baudoinia panamericana (strain UAMH 10762) TaxID=717646 RepID=M2M8A4_BAUPA|nr:uncharacterized protein BAUCODRAFT_76882 [Baudoinia panamericana UAMH 10762]EMC92591.1 hypothetical protein BAUCODRAFT_76882 [Baudoinia panamericana UAMH 10762]
MLPPATPVTHHRASSLVDLSSSPQQPPPSLPVALIDLGGDVILTVGPEETAVRVKVSKAPLALVSKVFATLLGPAFREGADIAALKDIALPDDDPKVMRTMLEILHMRFAVPKTALPGKELLGLAIVADKYDCVRALQMSLESIFPKRVATHGSFEELGDLINASYILDHPHLFEQYTQDAVKRYSRPYKQFGQSDVTQQVPEHLWCMLSYKAGNECLS